MGSASVSSIITTLVTYLQRLGISVNMPNLKIPDSMKSVVGFFVNIFKEIQTYFPAIPDFDVRANLIILCFGIPFLLDLIFVLFLSKLADSLMHLVDILCFGVFTYFVANGIYTGWPVTTISFAVLFGVVVVIRIIMMIFSKMQKSRQFQGLASEICGYYLTGIIPDAKSSKSMRSLHDDIVSFSDIIAIVPRKTSVVTAVILFVFGTIFLIAALWASNVFTIVKPLPHGFQVLVTAVCIIISFILYLIFIMKITKCGRSIATKFKQFCLRWGLKIMLTALDMLYIPILEALVETIIPERIGCDEGYYMYSVDHKKDDILWPFVDHPSECRPCTNTSYKGCIGACNAQKELRIPSSPALNYVNDIIPVVYPFMAYTIFGVMIGLPLLWGFLIKRNKMFISAINVHGETAEIKWQAILRRMKTTATYIFEDFKLSRVYWGVYLLANKFVLMIIDSVSDNYITEFNYLLPVFFLFSAAITIYFKPFINKFNNLYESSLDITNLLFAVILIVNMHGFDFPAWLGFILIVVVFAVPVVLIFFIICSESRKIGTTKHLEDFTFIRTVEEEEELLQKENKSHHFRHSFASTRGVSSAEINEPLIGHPAICALLDSDSSVDLPPPSRTKHSNQPVVPCEELPATKTDDSLDVSLSIKKKSDNVIDRVHATVQPVKQRKRGDSLKPLPRKKVTRPQKVAPISSDYDSSSDDEQPPIPLGGFTGQSCTNFGPADDESARMMRKASQSTMYGKSTTQLLHDTRIDNEYIDTVDEYEDLPEPAQIEPAFSMRNMKPKNQPVPTGIAVSVSNILPVKKKPKKKPVLKTATGEPPQECAPTEDALLSDDIIPMEGVASSISVRNFKPTKATPSEGIPTSVSERFPIPGKPTQPPKKVKKTTKKLQDEPSICVAESVSMRRMSKDIKQPLFTDTPEPTGAIGQSTSVRRKRGKKGTDSPPKKVAEQPKVDKKAAPKKSLPFIATPETAPEIAPPTFPVTSDDSVAEPMWSDVSAITSDDDFGKLVNEDNVVVEDINTARPLDTLEVIDAPDEKKSFLQRAEETLQAEAKARKKAAGKAASDLLRLDRLSPEEKIPANEVPLPPGILDTVEQMHQREMEASHGIAPSDSETFVGFTVNKRIAAIRMTKMYQTLNLVCDGATLDFLTTIVDSAVLLGALGVGWYLGALYGKYSTVTQFHCD